jgi:hypothetical protein
MAVNRIGQSRRVFDEEGPIDVISLGNANLFTLVKWTRDRSERALIAINRNGSLPQSSSMRAAGHSLRAPAARIKSLPTASLDILMTIRLVSWRRPESMRYWSLNEKYH